jgi:hypothetical protein
MGLWLIIIGVVFALSLGASIYSHKQNPREWRARSIITFPLSAAITAAFISGLFILMFSQSSPNKIPITSDKKIPIDLTVRKFHMSGNNSIAIIYDDTEPQPNMFGLFITYPSYPVHFDSIYFDAETPYYRQIIRSRPGTFFRFSEGSVESILHLPNVFKNK